MQSFSRVVGVRTLQINIGYGLGVRLFIMLSRDTTKAVLLQRNLFCRSKTVAEVKRPMQQWPNPVSRPVSI
ncbi:hypothetical protein HAX54_048889 [Datura stramonium]|uniref:Uncharacterized protein n=1 Tax=Datura stramonium TaxID=4076 RepID=A0ABS8SW60_DATST|nr:hypothetical protein [Datura stramonium]